MYVQKRAGHHVTHETNVCMQVTYLCVCKKTTRSRTDKKSAMRAAGSVCSFKKLWCDVRVWMGGVVKE